MLRPGVLQRLWPKGAWPHRVWGEGPQMIQGGVTPFRVYSR